MSAASPAMGSSARAPPRAASEPASPAATAATPIFHDWTTLWDADPTTVAAPRYTIGNDSMSRNRKHRSRDTFLDRHQRAKSWVPGPGKFKKMREFDLESDPKKEEEEDSSAPNFSLGKLKDRSVPHKFSRSVRQASLPDLKSVSRTLLPSSHLTPGPGEYCAFSTFGSPSGPTRRRYFAVNKGDVMGQGRQAEKFSRTSERF